MKTQGNRARGKLNPICFCSNITRTDIRGRCIHSPHSVCHPRIHWLDRGNIGLVESDVSSAPKFRQKVEFFGVEKFNFSPPHITKHPPYFPHPVIRTISCPGELRLSNWGGNFSQILAEKAYVRTRLADFWPKKAYVRTRKSYILALKKTFGQPLAGASRGLKELRRRCKTVRGPARGGLKAGPRSLA
jgi:hypothetical protein